MKRPVKTEKSSQKLVFAKQTIRELKHPELELGSCAGGVIGETGLVQGNC
jgi:hypothetical protein